MPYFPEFTDRFAAWLESLRGARVLLVGHARPDGDCVGSIVGLSRLLATRGVASRLVLPDPVPRRLAFLAASDPFLPATGWEPGDDRVVFVDCADRLRAGRALMDLLGVPAACFDHHLSNEGFARMNFVDAACSATSELLAGLAYDAGLRVDAPAALALYVGIMTDTGRFSYPSTTRRTLELAGRLMADGADPALAASEVYEKESMARMRLLGRFLASLRFFHGGRVCVGVLPLGVFEETGATLEDTEGLVEYARAIEGVEFGVLLEERREDVKGSLRSRRAGARSDLAAARFGGGGHACAAGFKTPGGLARIEPELLATLGERLAALDATTQP